MDFGIGQLIYQVGENVPAHVALCNGPFDTYAKCLNNLKSYLKKNDRALNLEENPYKGKFEK